MPLQPYRPRRGAPEQRRINIERNWDMMVKDTRYQTRILILGAGESSIQIPFPVRFSGRPHFFSGFEFDESSWPEAQSYPLAAAFVVSWDIIDEIEGAHPGFYAGATVATRIDAPTLSNFWLHCTFDGKAARNPLAQVDTPESTI